jgi:CheY-like chemotaxis protein
VKHCRSVLIVEDDDAIRETMRVVLEMEGYTVYAANDGKEGIEVLSGMPRPCLILLDLMMPVMDGWAFVKALRHDVALATIPVVVVTAFSERAHDIKAEAIVKKPIDMDHLYKLVRDFCGPGA